ncbi:ferredoxin reductase family protein [Vibrio sp. Hal054]|uniref:ferredoxin reductase family protein n=1 Tax=Vibrio sp. Hal054 TaxID=3035158 RepID=UPI00301CD74F
MYKFAAILTLLWLPSLPMNLEDLDNFFIWRHHLTMYTGLIGLGYMGLAVLLAARFRWLEKKVDGLDKGYRLHKNLGIGATVSLFFHWLIIKSGNWLVGAGVLERPSRGPIPELDGVNWQAVAVQIGDISFKVFIIFSIISLYKTIDYNKFKFTHKIGGLLMIAGIIHTFFLLDWDVASALMNFAIVIISVFGFVGAWLSLSGGIGKKNTSEGHVVSIEDFSATLEQKLAVRFSIKLSTDISYKEGQFAYLNFHDGEAPHPFSILNFDMDNQRIEFGVKDLGDYTHKMVNSLKVGQKVTVEGGYGAFQIPRYGKQVWIGAGIGIVPFVSRLYWLTRENNKRQYKLEKVHLFYCVNSEKEAFFRNEILSLLQRFDFVELHMVISDLGEFLDSNLILEKMKSNNFETCFCGSQQFGSMLKTELSSAGVSHERFHTELFMMR